MTVKCGLMPRTTDMVNEAQRRHDTWPTASAAIGRTMTASLMLGAMLKGEDKLTVKIEGGGPIGAIVADANAKGEVRAYVSNPHVHFDLNEQGKLDVRRAVGTDGTLSVVKDLGLRDYFTGQVEIVSVNSVTTSHIILFLLNKSLHLSA